MTMTSMSMTATGPMSTTDGGTTMSRTDQGDVPGATWV
jgi:hypothetical protein